MYVLGVLVRSSEPVSIIIVPKEYDRSTRTWSDAIILVWSYEPVSPEIVSVEFDFH